MTHSELSNDIISAAIKVHRQLGPGLLESAYRQCLSHELQQQGMAIEKEKPMLLSMKD
ncbi:MAG: GxxExxY protein [Chryseolinea sp.]